MSTPLALIAAARSGLGSSLARRFSKSDIVILLARTEERYPAVVDDVTSAGGEAVGYTTANSDPERVQEISHED